MEAQDPLGMHRCDRTCGRKLNCAFASLPFPFLDVRLPFGVQIPTDIFSSSRRYPQLRASRPQGSLPSLSPRRFRRVRHSLPFLCTFLVFLLMTDDTDLLGFLFLYRLVCNCGSTVVLPPIPCNFVIDCRHPCIRPPQCTSLLRYNAFAALALSRYEADLSPLLQAVTLNFLTPVTKTPPALPVLT